MSLSPQNDGHQHVAIYAGSFDPITYGHLDVLTRARSLFDSIVLGIGINPEKSPMFSLEERVTMARSLVEEIVRDAPDLAPVRVEQYQGLTVDFAGEAKGTQPPSVCATSAGIGMSVSYSGREHRRAKITLTGTLFQTMWDTTHKVTGACS